MTYNAAHLLCAEALDHLTCLRWDGAEVCLSAAVRLLMPDDGEDLGRSHREVTSLVIFCRDRLIDNEPTNTLALLPVAIKLLSERIKPTKELPGLGEIGERAQKAVEQAAMAKDLGVRNRNSIEKIKEEVKRLYGCLDSVNDSIDDTEKLRIGPRLAALEASQIRVPVALPHPEEPTPEPVGPLKFGSLLYVADIDVDLYDLRAELTGSPCVVIRVDGDLAYVVVNHPDTTGHDDDGLNECDMSEVHLSRMTGKWGMHDLTFTRTPPTT